MSNIEQELQILKETKVQIKDAIKAKGQEVLDNDSFRSYAEKINNIITLEEGTSDADANFKDLIAGKTAYVNGEKITGNIKLYDLDSSTAFSRATPFKSGIVGLGLEIICNDYRYAFEQDSKIRLTTDNEAIASLLEISSDQIVKGNTILGVEGTYEGSGGLDTSSDNPITAQDIVIGKEGFVNGEKITGTMPKASAENTAGELEAIEVNDEAVIFTAIVGGVTESIVYLPDAEFETAEIPMAVSVLNLAEVIGLTADKIKKGETILGIEGTYEGSFEETLTPAEYTDAIDLTEDILNNNEEV